MNSQPSKEARTARERLLANALLLQSILRYRERERSPGYGWDIERAIVERELRELEEDIRLDSTGETSAVVRIARNAEPDSRRGSTR